MSERARGGRRSDEGGDEESDDQGKREDVAGKKTSRFGRIRARNNASRGDGPGGRESDVEGGGGGGGGGSRDDDDDDDDDDEGGPGRRAKAQEDAAVPRSPAQRLVDGSMAATFGRFRKSMGADTQRGGEGKLDDRQARGGPVSSAGSTVSALAHGMMDRSAKLKTTMMSMMGDRAGSKPQDAGRQKQEDEDDGGDEADGEDPLQSSSSPERRSSSGKGSRRSRLQKTQQQRNKENVGGTADDSVAASEKEPGALDKLTQRLKRRGMTRRSSKELGESKGGGDSDYEEEEEAEGKGTVSRGSPSKSGVTFDPDRPYMRTIPTAQLKARRQLLDRVVVEKAPELHIVGEISGGQGFDSGVSCRWILEMGKFWSHLAGEQYGQTHTVYSLAEDGDQAYAVWNHPLDVHLTTTSIQGWPRLIFQVSRLDDLGRHTVVGYGFEHIPLVPGAHQVEVSCWRPTGSMQDELAAYFLGVTPQLLDTDVVFTKAWDQRCRLVTLPSGRIHLQLNIVLRHFSEYDVDVQ